MARNARNGSSKFPIVPAVAIGLGALTLLYFATRPKAPARERVGGGGGGGAFGPPRGEEVWAPFVNTIIPGNTFKAYRGEADVSYSALAAPDRVRGRIRARNLQTNQEEDVPLYAINRLGTDPSLPGL